MSLSMTAPVTLSPRRHSQPQPQVQPQVQDRLGSAMIAPTSSTPSLAYTLPPSPNKRLRHGNENGNGNHIGDGVDHRIMDPGLRDTDQLPISPTATTTPLSLSPTAYNAHFNINGNGYGYGSANGDASGSHRTRSNTTNTSYNGKSPSSLTRRGSGNTLPTSKSAPTSPSGRITMHGLTPISSIGGMQLSHTQSHPQVRNQLQPQPQAHAPLLEPIQAHNGNRSQNPNSALGQTNTHTHTHAQTQGRSQTQPIPIPSSSTSHGLYQQPTYQHQPQHQFKPSHVHSHSLPPTNVNQLLPSHMHPQQTQNQIQNQAQAQQRPAGPHRTYSASSTYYAASQPQAGPSRTSAHPQIPLHSASSSFASRSSTSSSSSYNINPSSVNKARRQTTFSRQADSTDSANDSDATVKPRATSGKGSLSQPDLTVLRSKRVEGWADGVMRENTPTSTSAAASNVTQSSAPVGEERKVHRPVHQRTKTPPSRPVPLSHTYSVPAPPANEAWLPASPSNSRSHPSLSSLRKSPSPRSSDLSMPSMSPIVARAPLSSSSEDEYHGRDRHFSWSAGGGGGGGALGLSGGRPGFGGIIGGFGSGGMSSEDADDDYESTDSPSSESLTFSPKRTKTGSLRQRFPLDKTKYSPNSGTSASTSGSATGLGLSLNPTDSPSIASPRLPAIDQSNLSWVQKMGMKTESWLAQSSLLPLRLLAIVPSLWGIAVLARALWTGGIWYDVWPWGVDLSREALEKLVAGDGWNEGTWRGVRRGDVLLSIAWAICTGHFCFSLTTGLTHRWRSYYSLPSTITRLVSLQCLCWPATYVTLWVLGAERILLCWIVIGVTTGWSRTVQMWVTSNVVTSAFPPSPKSDHDPSNDGIKAVSRAFSHSRSNSKTKVQEGGDLTPNLRRKGSKALIPAVGQGPPEIPEGLTTWEAFKWGRRWDWDGVAREVGWKVGSLLLVTTAWLFWGIEQGKVLRL